MVNSFMTSFNCVQDSSHFIYDLDTPELLDRDELINDNGQSHFWVFVNERKLVEDGLVGLTLEGIYFQTIFLVSSKFVLIPILSLFCFSC